MALNLSTFTIAVGSRVVRHAVSLVIVDRHKDTLSLLCDRTTDVSGRDRHRVSLRARILHDIIVMRYVRPQPVSCCVA